jgi:ribosomal protein S18 acetylase RimI-like enzyme
MAVLIVWRQLYNAPKIMACITAFTTENQHCRRLGICLPHCNKCAWRLPGLPAGTLRKKGARVRIRPYLPADLPILKSITTEAFEGVSIDQGIEHVFGLVRGHGWKWRKARHLDDDLVRPQAAVFVAEQENQILGYITTWQDREAGIGHIPNVAITAEARGQGLGRQLIEHALAHFRAAGLSHAKIETLAQNDVGNHLYRSLGFQEVARQVHFLADLSAKG